MRHPSRDEGKPGRAAPTPATRPRVDLVYRPVAGALTLPGAVQENRQRPDRGEGEPPLADRLIAPRRRAGGIFRLTARGEPEYDGQILRWRPGGRYDYRGLGGTFDAWVGPDGSVGFRDHASVSGPPSARPSYAPPLEDPSTPHLKPTGGVAMWTLGTFDVTDAVMRRLGQDPYGAEKKRFAEATASWRAGLRVRFQEAVQRRVVAAAGLAGPLCRRYDAASDAGRQTIRRELFQRWDECREDNDGRAVRRALLGALRRCGIRYPAAELSLLNRGRQSQEAFAP